MLLPIYVSGCLTYDTLYVRVFDNEDIQVPTAFSPNGDGHNDYLDVFPVGITKFLSFKIYSRWGNVIFETTDPQKKWDGNFKGQKQPSDTYVWMAQGKNAKGQVVTKRGQTVLIR